MGLIQVPGIRDSQVAYLASLPDQQALRIGQIRTPIESQVDVPAVNGDVEKHLLEPSRETEPDRNGAVSVVDNFDSGGSSFDGHAAQRECQLDDRGIVGAQKLN